MTLIPVRVQIGLKAEGRGNIHSYPDFNSLPPELRDGMDWSHFVDRYGGWHYDQAAGHIDHDPENDSPRGTWLGMLLVPEAFAKAAADAFPDQVTIISEAEAETFYEQRAHANDAEIHEDATVLQAIAAKRALGIVETQHDKNALDVDHPTPGRRVNKCKTWAGYLAASGLEIHPEHRKP